MSSPTGGDTFVHLAEKYTVSLDLTATAQCEMISEPATEGGTVRSPDSLFDTYVAKYTDHEDAPVLTSRSRVRYATYEGPTWAQLDSARERMKDMRRNDNGAAKGKAVIEAAKARAIAYMVDNLSAYGKLVGSGRHRSDIESAGYMDSPAGPFPADKGIAHWVYEAAKGEGIAVPDRYILTITAAATPTWREVYNSLI